MKSCWPTGFHSQLILDNWSSFCTVNRKILLHTEFLGKLCKVRFMIFEIVPISLDFRRSSRHFQVELRKSIGNHYHNEEGCTKTYISEWSDHVGEADEAHVT